ncbi:MAG: TonB-dependent receptor [Odoribacteraceae bacterium]|nr:TonB-dependent receptor [Odoribacteraceae bacterium]
MNYRKTFKWQIFAGQATRLARVSMLSCVAILLTCLQANAQQRVTGTVTDKSGETLVGASVVERGTTNGASTDVNGNFTLTVSPDATLVVRFIGYLTTNVTVQAGKTHYPVSLDSELQSLDEVVVVGYASVKKANLTGAVDQVGGRVLSERPIVSVAQALQGIVGNLNISSNTSTGVGGGGAPGARMSFNIRGVTGLSSGSSSSSAGPLFVVDGIQSQDINAINPDDIATISVLKDAASAAIYGSNAPYGVVLITTKRGGKTDKPVVTYGANFGWSSPINLPKQVNSVEWMEIMNEAGQNTRGSNFLDASTMQRIQDYFDGKITTSTVAVPSRKEWANFDNFGEGLGNDNVEWYSVFFKKNSMIQQHNLGLSGGSTNSTYYVGLGYTGKEGILRYGEDSYNRYSIRGNVSSTVNKWLTANFRGSFTRGINDSPSSTGNDNFMQQIAQKWPIIPMITPDGYYSEQSNIEAYLHGGRNKTTDDVLVATGEIVLTPLKGWEATFNYTFTNNNVVENKDVLHYTLYDTDKVPYYSPAWTSDGFTKYTRGRDVLDRTHANYAQHTINAFTSYELDKNGHYLKGMIGFAQEAFYNYKLTVSTGSGTLYTTDLPTFNTIYGNIVSANEPTKETLTTRGVFGRINYGYKERYLLELNGRHDGSSRYLSDVRFKFYPGVSAAWVTSLEDFWGTDAVTSKIDMLKLRVSYGSLGEQSGGYYPFYPSLTTVAATNSANKWLFNGNRYTTISYPGIVNPKLTWITSTTIDFGVDVSALANRLLFNFDWYRRSSNDVVGPAEQLPAVLGAAAPSTNNASLKTTGFELTLTWRDKIGDFTYSARATLADSRSVVKKYPNAEKSLNTWYNGAVIGDFWGYVTEGYYTQAEQDAGIDQARQQRLGTNWTAGDVKYKNLDDDPLITPGESTLADPGDRKIIGNSTPRYTYGITLEAAWKGFDINMFFQGIGKRDYWMGDVAVGNFWGLSNSEWQANLLTVHKDRWTPATPNGYFPKYYLTSGQNTKNQVAQTKYLQDASYLRFKNLQVGYTLPGELLDRLGIGKLRVYISGENLVTWTDFIKTIDPEFLSNRGLIYPLQRTWSVGLNLSF